MIVPLLGAGIQGKSEVISAQHRINCYVEIAGDADKGALSLIGTPGLEEFCDLDAIDFIGGGTTLQIGYGPVRAIQPWIYSYSPTSGGLTRVEALLVVRGDRIIAINKDGKYLTQLAVTSGVAPSGGSEIMDSGVYQLAGQRYCVFTDSGLVLYYTDQGSLAWRRVSDADAVASTSLAIFGTDILVTTQGSESFYLTPDLTTWDPLDFASAEALPDELVRIYRNGDTVLLFGEAGVEFWARVDSADFPYAPIKGANVDYGLVAKWSVAKVGGAVVYLAKNPAGQVSLVRLSGYQASKISSQDWDAIVNDYAETADAEAFAYTMGGHAFYQISFPTAGKTWLFDATTGAFSELQSDNANRHRARLNAFAFGDHFVTDYANGKIYRMRHDIYSDNGTPIHMEFRTKHFFKDYQNVTVNALHLDIESGVGINTGQGSDPKIMMQYSTDNGRGWSNELWEGMGVGGDTLKRAEWRRLGIGRDFTFRVVISDPVKRVIAGMSIDATPGRK